MDRQFDLKIEDKKPLNALSDFTRKVASETILLLKNDHNVLPIKDKKVAVFGRIQSHYYKSGTGSGGLVNVKHVSSVIEALKNHPLTHIDETIYKHYQTWIDKNPYDAGNGQWASEPWAQQEMIMDDHIIKESAKNNDCALVVFGRTAGEDKDCFNGPGSYLLSDLEEKVLKQVTDHFKQVIVVLNIGNMMDLGFLDRYNVDGLVIAWHGGMNGAHALADCLTGLVSPSAKLPMTVVKDLKDIPSNDQFGQMSETFYTEDIYVGYRYFETFNKKAVRFPFGFGLSYTNFNIKLNTFKQHKTNVELSVDVLNIGEYAGKEVIQIYVEMPQGLLGKPHKVLTSFGKSMYLKPQASETLTFKFDLMDFASFDDVGFIQAFSYVLEKGDYLIYMGTDVRSQQFCGKVTLETNMITKQLSENMAPIKPFKRLKPLSNLALGYEDVPLRTIDYNQKIIDEAVTPLNPKNENFSLLDVHQKRIKMDQFIQSLSVDEMIQLSRGEGMSSPKVTPGTAAAFGGVTGALLKKGIPVCCAADGPSGIRMDSGGYASSLPSGTALAASFNLSLVEELYHLLGLEMRGYAVDTLLGPGMNILRHPLNGRNFEYFSEDPLLTGLMASSYIKGLHKAGVDGTLKHLACNNQETDRFNVDAVVSQRALREIYLKGFEIAVKDADARAVMTSYNPVNGLWSASNYELTKSILRDEWGFNGFVMTDWWAKMNDYQKPASRNNTKAMIISQNDLYMVVTDSFENSSHDNSKAAFEANALTTGQLQSTTKHILNYIVHTPAFYKHHNLKFKLNTFKHNNLFKMTSNRMFKPAFLKTINLNNKDILLSPYQTHIKIDENIVSTKLDVILNKQSNRGILKHQSDTDVTIYDIVTNQKESHKQKLAPIPLDKIIDVQGKNWDKVYLDIKKILDTNEGVMYKDHLIFIDAANAMFEYGLNIHAPGKYIFEIQIMVDATDLAQVPFSIFVDDQHQATLTLRSTNHSFIETKAFIIMDAGIHRMKFKFNQGGMIIKTIHVIKHG